MTINGISGTLKNFLSASRTVNLLFFLALFCRMENALFNQDFNSDKETQIIAAQSFLSGNGITIPNAKCV